VGPVTGSIADRARGLVDSHELAESPGALTIAENVVVEPGGSIAVRPTFTLVSAVSSTRKPRTLIPYAGAWAAVDDDGGTLKFRTSAASAVSGAMVLPSGCDETPWISSRSSLYLGTNLGWRKVTSAADTASEGAGIEFEIVRDIVMLVVSGTGPEAVPWTGQVAYRMCVRRKDPNGYVVRSKPTQRIVTEANLIGGTSVLGDVNIPRHYIRGLVAGDVVEWYRTRGSGGPTVVPASSHYLVCEYTITSSDVSNGYFYNTTRQFDTTTDDDLGAALYTNPEREGIAKAKYEPPIARAGAVFNRCAWYADTTSKHRIVGSLRGVGTVWGFQGDTTIGTDTITNVPAVTGLEVGQYVCDSNNTPKANGTHFAARTRITAISAAPGPYTVTVSANASASTAGVYFGACDWIEPSVIGRYLTLDAAVSGAGVLTFDVVNATGVFPGMYVWDNSIDDPFTAGAIFQASTKVVSVSGTGPYTITIDKTTVAGGFDTLTVGDWITIAGSDFVAVPYSTGYGPFLPNRTRVFPIVVAGTADPLGVALRFLQQAVNFHCAYTGFNVRMIPTGNEDAYGSLTSGDFVLEEYGLGGSSFTLVGNTGSNGPLAFWPTIATAITSSNDAATNRVTWSAPDEPEAVPLINLVDIATSSARVLRVVPLRASMLVFTTEGLYRIAGVPPDAWSVDLIDPSLVLLSRNCADVIDNVCFAWTTRGVVRVDESGFVDVSTGAIGKRLDVYARLVEASGYHVWVAAWKAAHFVLVGAGDDATNGETDEVFCFNTLSNAWTSWPITIRRAQEIGSKLYTVRGDRYDVQVSDGTSLGYDRTHTIAAWTYTAGSTTVTITAGNYSPWRPRAGDYLRATIGGNPQFRRVFEQGGSTFRISRPFTSATISAMTGFEVAAVDLEWTPATAGALMGLSQKWREGVVTIDTSDFSDASTSTTVIESEPGFGATTSAAEETVPRKIIELANFRTLPMRFAVPRMLARSSILHPRFKMSVVGWPCRIFGVTMQREGGSPRVHR
jgi:hypothetical protein